MALGKSVRTAMLGWVSRHIGAPILRAWLSTIKTEVRAIVPSADPLHDDCERSYIYVTWHEHLLLPAYTFRRGNKCRTITIISQSQDGEYITRIVEQLGWEVIRGSSSRGALRVLRDALALDSKSQRTHLCFLPDGPRGPRRHFQSGAIFIASKTGLPIVPLGIAYDRPRRLRSWDRFALPRPFTRAVLTYGEPVCIPSDIDRFQLERYRNQIEQTVNRLTESAEDRLVGVVRMYDPPRLERVA